MALLLALGLAASLAAAPLLPVRLSDQGRVPTGADGHLVVVDGTPLVLAQHQGWMQKEGAGWQALAWEHEGTFAGAFGDGRTAFAFYSDDPAGPVQRLNQLLLAQGRLTSRLLPPLPWPLRYIHGAVKEDRVFVHGVDEAGVPHLLALTSEGGVPVWRAYAGCAAAVGKMEALVAQQDSLYAVVTPPDGSGQRLHRWSAGQAWAEVSRLPGQLVPGAARATGQAHLLCLVGDREPPRMVTFYTITQVWAELGQQAAADIHASAAWGNGFLLAQISGQDLALSLFELVPTKQLLHQIGRASCRERV